jgi:hypothetical protein
MVYGGEQQQAAAALWYVQCVLWLRIFYFWEYIKQVQIS